MYFIFIFFNLMYFLFLSFINIVKFCYFIFLRGIKNSNFLLIERKGNIGKYWF